MPKKKKTREQKIAAEQRRHQHLEAPATAPSGHTTYSLPTVNTATAHKPTHTTTHAVATADYRYLSHDLLKTALVTLAVVVIELLIRFFVHGV